MSAGETVWVDGPLTRAARNGAICYLDEIVEARKDTMVIHPLADDRRILPMDNDACPLDAETIAHWLAELLEVEFSYRDTQPAAQALARLARESQDYVLDWVARITSTNIQLVCQFANRVTALLTKTRRSVIEAWLLHAMDQYDRFGLRISLKTMQNVNHFEQRSRELAG